MIEIAMFWEMKYLIFKKYHRRIFCNIAIQKKHRNDFIRRIWTKECNGVFIRNVILKYRYRVLL